ncbi:MAG: ribosomal protein S18-alanine N-acetyltransferase [Desulfomonilia bacterium]|nr:ribosomal protein S18-alanine N-acetyltransferase [Desulfomonilia bacterium]
MDAVVITDLSHGDLASIMEIESCSFPSPWELETFIMTLEDPRCICYAARIDGLTIGYCLSLDMKHMLHVLNLAVHPEFRRRGVAKRLISEMIVCAKTRERIYVVLEVRPSNIPARLLYTSLGFLHVSTWNEYYTDTREDADVMVKKIEESAG